MHPLVRWAAIGLGAVAGLFVLLVAVIYIGSNMMLAKSWPLPEGKFHPPREASIAQGRHLTVVLGCTDCHGRTLEGEQLDFIPNSTVYGPNLVKLGEHFSDGDFEHAIRHGLKPDGSSVVVMPANQYANLSDRELGSIVAYIRSIPAKASDTPAPRYGLLVRAGLLLGKFSTEVAMKARYKAPADLGPEHAAGRHIAMLACGECHGSDLAGVNSDLVKTPDLSLVAAYDRGDFLHFMKTGRAAGDRELSLMSATARHRFSHFSDAEVNAVYEYLAARGQKLAAE